MLRNSFNKEYLILGFTGERGVRARDLIQISSFLYAIRRRFISIIVNPENCFFVRWDDKLLTY